MSDGTATINNITNNRSDNAEYNPDGYSVDVVGRGSDNADTAVNAAVEDREATKSETTGRISQREVDDLHANHFPGEGETQGYTRGAKVDAYKQERDVDQSLVDGGVLDSAGQEYD